MAFVTVPKDLSKVKSKVAFNLTKRRIICFGAVALAGIPFYVFTKDILVTSISDICMVMIMLPFFFLYFKSLFALGFQGFFTMVIVAIYAVLINNLTIASDIHSALFSVGAYTVLLCFALMKTGSLSKALFGTL